MTRDEFLALLVSFSDPDLPEENREIQILAEYDRLTALNAQLLEACKHAANWIDALYITEKHDPSSSSLLRMIDAAIRAAEEARDA